MQISQERSVVLFVSLGLTALLLGAGAGAGLVYRIFGERVQDPAYLEQQLSRLVEEETEESAPVPALVRVCTVERKRIQPQRPLVGRLVEVRMVTVASEVAGRINALPLEEGAEVVGGETVLAEIDDTWVRLALAQTRATVRSTKATLAFERSELERVQQLAEQSASSLSEVEAKRARVEELGAALEEAEARVAEQSEKQGRSVIRAPFDGTVVTKHAEMGEYVSPGTPIVQIVSRGEVDARIMVPESVVNWMAIGQEFPVHIDPLGRELSGRVVSVTPYGPAASRTFPVRLRLDDQDGLLKVGMSVTATVATGPAEDALVVSRDAVLVRPEGATIWVAVGDSPDQVHVQPIPVAIRVQTRTELAIEAEEPRDQALLGPGSSVVIEGAERLLPGQLVRIVTLDESISRVAE